VTVLLPRARSRAARLPGAAEGADAAAGARLRVLVVDDDRAVREMASEMLSERGHETVLASDAAEAVALLRQAADGSIAPFDMMLADYVMPGMNGVALIETAQALCPRMHALLVTGNVEFEAAERMSAAEIMRKPFTIAQLEERVAALLSRRRAREMQGAA
jgi:CheY-like chemotaxis protein